MALVNIKQVLYQYCTAIIGKSYTLKYKITFMLFRQNEKQTHGPSLPNKIIRIPIDNVAANGRISRNWFQEDCFNEM